MFVIFLFSKSLKNEKDLCLFNDLSSSKFFDERSVNESINESIKDLNKTITRNEFEEFEKLEKSKKLVTFTMSKVSSKI